MDIHTANVLFALLALAIGFIVVPAWLVLASDRKVARRAPSRRLARKVR